MPPEAAKFSFLADTGIGLRVAAWLEGQGHEVAHLASQGLHRLPDADVFAKAGREERILLTFDLDFGEIVALSQARMVSVIVFRLRNARPGRVIERIQSVLAECGPALKEGAIVLVEDTRHRVRLLPVGKPQG